MLKDHIFQHAVRQLSYIQLPIASIPDSARSAEQPAGGRVPGPRQHDAGRLLRAVGARAAGLPALGHRALPHT